MSFFELITLNILDVIQYYLLINKLHYKKLTFVPKHLIYIPVVVVISTVISYNMRQEFSYFAGSLFLLVLTWLCLKQDMYHSVFIHIVAVILVLTIQLVVFIPLNLVVSEVQFDYVTGIVAQCLSIAVVLCVVKWLPIHLLMAFVKNRNNTFRIVSINVYALLTVLVLYWYSGITGIWQNLLVLTILSVCFILINVIQIHKGLQNTYVEEQMSIYKQYLPIIDELIENLRIRQHDFDNHILALRMILHTNDSTTQTVAVVNEYLSDVESGFANSHLIKLNNKIVAGFLYSKIKFAQKNSVEFNIDIEHYVIDTDLKDYELVEILSILIDNAFEASSEESVVSVKIGKRDEKQYLEVVNTTEFIKMSTIDEFFQKGFSTKAGNNRGTGLYKLKKLLDRCGCEFEVTNRKEIGDCFSLTVWLA